jgi:arsenate reductase (thioredoxin)
LYEQKNHQNTMSDFFNVLVLCTHNSARSILSEAMINHWAAKLNKPIRAFSAGSAASGRVNPLALECLQGAGVDTKDLRSKSWDEFTLPSAPKMSAVITVCDNAANEQCPFWPGAPVQVHWGYADPSAALGNHNDRLAAFELTRLAIAYKALQLMHANLSRDSTELKKILNQIANA